jgi:hypothetical protein
MRISISVLLLLLFSGVVSGGQMSGHKMTPAPGGKVDPWVANDGKGGFFVAYVDHTATSANVMLQHTSDGRQFSAPVRVNHRIGDGAVRNENPPKVAVGPAGDVYVVWANEKERYKGNIRFARSVNGGRSFESAIDVNSDASGPAVGRAFQSIAVDHNGRIYIAWLDERNETEESRGSEIWFATSNDRGRTFSPDHRIVTDVCDCCRIALALDSAGRIYVSYRMVPAVARSDDGRTFTPHVVNHDGWELNACPIAGATMTIDSADHVHVIWFTAPGDKPRLVVASSTDHAASFSKPQVFDSTAELAKHAHVVAVSPDRLAVAWDDSQNNSTVKWGLLDPVHATVQLLGSRPGASYPVIAAAKGRAEVVALQQNKPDIMKETARFSPLK